MGDKAIKEWINVHLKNKDTSDLWDLTAAILTELSKRDSVQYRVRATEPTVAARMKQLDADLKDGTEPAYYPEWDETNVHDSEGC
tara:strand:+ start:56 stop:310 length:255 start_codon:yes stop_codon:yes gene_type:complete